MDHIKTTIQLFVVAVMLFSITGIQKSYHQCNSTGTYEYKISLPIVTQNATEIEFNCSCKANHSENDHCSACSGESKIIEVHFDCCKTGTETLFVSFEYLCSSISKVEKANELHLFKTTDSTLKSTLLTEIIRDNCSKKEPPPNIKKRGKEFLIHQSQLKIPLS